MKIQHNISLKHYNTFGIDVTAKEFVEINSIEDLQTLLSQEKSFFVLSGGSNILLTKDLNTLVVHLNIKGKKVVLESDTSVEVKVEAGENWHEFVLWSLTKNFGGLENLSLIPGNVGTSPMQNIGAYGVEVKDLITKVEVVDIDSGQIKYFDAKDCKFGYRDSIFKKELKGKVIITSVFFKLTKNQHKKNISYGAIKDQLKEMGVDGNPSIKDISKAVISIRNSKLPNPKEIGNSGSFFKNPVVTTSLFKKLQNQYPEIPNYPISETKTKIPAGWLIEKAGYKGKRFGEYGVHKKQALVLVNYGNAKGEDIYNLALKIQKDIERLFSIKLEMEVNIIK